MKRNLFELTGIIKNIIIQEEPAERFIGFDELTKKEQNKIKGGGGDDDDDAPIDWD